MYNNLKQTILEKTNNGKDIFLFYLGKEVGSRKLFKNPLYEDKKPSCSLFKGMDGMWRMKDFGDGGEFGGDAFWLVSKLKHLDMKSQFVDIMKEIISDLSLPIESGFYARKDYPGRIPESTHARPIEEVVGEVKTYKYKVKEFSKAELGFWKQYGIGKETLSLFKVYALESFEGVSATGSSYSIRSSDKEPLYMYDRGSFIKLYRPNSNIRFMYAGKKATDDYTFGEEHLPSKGETVFITGGEKDVMALYSHGFNAFCFNSETANSLTDEFAGILRERFKHIFILYDMDPTGRMASNSIINKFAPYSFRNLNLPLKGSKDEKDISDFFKMGYNASDLEKIIDEDISALHTKTKRILEVCELDFQNPPKTENVIFSVKGIPLGRAGELSYISEMKDSGKNSFVSALVAGMMRESDETCTLGVKIQPNREGKAVLLFDTEQLRSVLFENLAKSVQQGGNKEYPSWLHAISLRTASRSERLGILEESIAFFHHIHQGTYAVIINEAHAFLPSFGKDGSVELVDRLIRMAERYDTSIICALQEYPESDELDTEFRRKGTGTFRRYFQSW